MKQSTIVTLHNPKTLACMSKISLPQTSAQRNSPSLGWIQSNYLANQQPIFGRNLGGKFFVRARPQQADSVTLTADPVNQAGVHRRTLIVGCVAVGTEP